MSPHWLRRTAASAPKWAAGCPSTSSTLWEICLATTAAATTASAYVEIEENDSSPPMTRGTNNAEGVVPNSYYVEVNEDDEGCDDDPLPLKSEAKSETRNRETQRTEIEVYEQSDDGGSSNYQEMDFAPVPMLQPARTKGKAKQKKTKKTKSPKSSPRPSPLPFSFSSSPAPSSPSTPSAIPVPPPPPPPLRLIALSASSHSSGRRAAIQESADDGDIYHYMKKQQQTKGSMIVRPQDRQSYLQDQRSLQTQHGTTAFAVILLNANDLNINILIGGCRPASSSPADQEGRVVYVERAR